MNSFRTLHASVRHGTESSQWEDLLSKEWSTDDKEFS